MNDLKEIIMNDLKEIIRDLSDKRTQLWCCTELFAVVNRTLNENGFMAVARAIFNKDIYFEIDRMGQ